MNLKCLVAALVFAYPMAGFGQECGFDENFNPVNCSSGADVKSGVIAFDENLNFSSNSAGFENLFLAQVSYAPHVSILNVEDEEADSFLLNGAFGTRFKSKSGVFFDAKLLLENRAWEYDVYGVGLDESVWSAFATGGIGYYIMPDTLSVYADLGLGGSFYETEVTMGNMYYPVYDSWIEKTETLSVRMAMGLEFFPIKNVGLYSEVAFMHDFSDKVYLDYMSVAIGAKFLF